MTDNFLSDFNDEELEEDIPDWAQDLGGDEEEDEFAQLRRKSARAGSTYDEMVEEEEDAFSDSSSPSFSLQNFTPGQRFILAALVLLNVIVIAVGFLLLF